MAWARFWTTMASGRPATGGSEVWRKRSLKRPTSPSIPRPSTPAPPAAGGLFPAPRQGRVRRLAQAVAQETHEPFHSAPLELGQHGAKVFFRRPRERLHEELG